MKTYYDSFLGILSNGEMLSLSSAKFASPLGLTVLGTKIKKLFSSIFVRIYNFEVSDKEVLKTDIKAVVRGHTRVLVGLTLIAGNVLKSLQLASLAKTTRLRCNYWWSGSYKFDR
jgi:molybdopterin-binding protein